MPRLLALVASTLVIATLSGCVDPGQPEGTPPASPEIRPVLPLLSDYAGCTYYVEHQDAAMCGGNIQSLASAYVWMHPERCIARAGQADILVDLPSDALYFALDAVGPSSSARYVVGSLRWNDGPTYAFTEGSNDQIRVQIPGAHVHDLVEGGSLNVSVFALNAGGQINKTDPFIGQLHTLWYVDPEDGGPAQAIFRMVDTMQGEFTFPPAEAPTAYSLTGEDFTFHVTGSVVMAFDDQVKLLDDRC